MENRKIKLEINRLKKIKYGHFGYSWKIYFAL